MSNNQTSSDPSTESEGMQETCEQLQHQLKQVLMLTCVVSLTLMVFVGMNLRAIQRTVHTQRGIVAEHQTKTQPALQNLSVKLVEYGKTHPDIQPLLKKYGVAVPTNAPGGTPRK